ncbi:MAG: hypothetical protein K9G24_02340 [Candidatus Nanopelagicales bacterium]|nr:hypothetical protein [Candidatus Nanopelagicales bacterium]MCF8538255.1 hypothetical protein [Candidatus Nanopelagicales bacterium]MCF8541902.1 hypothetical protein [Candidatus Nanopelagicales bacterium]MCF8556634.1 hypothetical protein [Candidatus Nanopelagicales bacterium]
MVRRLIAAIVLTVAAAVLGDPLRGDTMTRRHNEDALVHAAATGRTIEQIAEDLSMSRGTVARRLNEPATQHRIRVRRAEVASELTASPIDRAHTAADLLMAVIVDEFLAPQHRVRAATSLLAEARAWRDADMEGRLVAVKEALSGQNALRHI